jgi:hydroxymethylglutaryl-CoA lyase
LQTALEAGVKEIAIFASATEGFSQKNLNCSVK